MARLTPYELTFGGVEEHFGVAREEAEALGKDTADFAQFVSLPTVQRIVAEIESPDLLAANPPAAIEYHTLVYAAFQFWVAGKHLLKVADDFPSDALPGGTMPDTNPSVPGGACYIQLPERSIWAQVDPTSPHEPIDGLFVCLPPRFPQLTVVAILGLRAGRAGFSQISARVALSDLEAVREGIRSQPFDPVMDGGRAAGFHSITSLGELLLLTQLALTQAAS